VSLAISSVIANRSLLFDRRYDSDRSQTTPIETRTNEGMSFLKYQYRHPRSSHDARGIGEVWDGEIQMMTQMLAVAAQGP
jgi:hypothetical protein